MGSYLPFLFSSGFLLMRWDLAHVWEHLPSITPV